MKKLILSIILVCFLAIPAYAFNPLVVCGGGVVASANSCPEGTYELGYDGDHDSGADYVCYESGTANEQGTTQDATVSTSYVEYSAINDYLKFTLTGDISANIDEQGSIFWSFWITDDEDISDDAMVELYYSATEIIKCYVLSIDAVVGTHLGGAQSNNVYTTSFAAGTNYRCGYTWDATENKHALDCVTTGSVEWTSNGGNPDDEDSEAIDPFDDSGAVDPTTFVIGEDLSGQGVQDPPVRVWDVFITTGYKGTDPGSL